MKSMAENTFLFWDQKKYHCQLTFLRGKKPKWIFHNLGNLLRPLELVPASRERVVPTEWQIRTVLADCISRARVIPVQAPQFRQYPLIGGFLDLANLSIQEEAALATNWIKDRPEGLKLQNLALATMTGPTLSNLPRNLTADVQYAVYKCESFTGIHLHLQGIFRRIRQSFDVIFCRICTSSAVCCFGAPLVAILTSLQPAVNPLLGCSSGKPVQDLLVLGFVL